jgi:muramidase (phage lysozyme)
MDANLKAFLHLIRTGEGTLGENGYRTIYGGSLFDSFDDHPRKKITAGRWTSTAAGAYQFLEKTWDALVKQNPWTLTDFSQEKQDAAAVMLIKGRKAYDDVLAGRFVPAINKCNREWASLPGSPYGQPTLTMEKALKILADAGGVIVEETKPKEKDMSLAGSIIMSALPKLIGALPELSATMKKPEIADRNVEFASKIGSILMGSTGATNEQEAVERVLADPQTAREANEALRMSRAELVDLLERINTLDQGNIKSAREYNTTEPFMVDTPRFKLKFIHILSMVFVLFAGSFVSFQFGALSSELKGAIITLMIIGGWNGVKDYWMGSSSGSDKKTELMRGEK